MGGANTGVADGQHSDHSGSKKSGSHHFNLHEHLLDKDVMNKIKAEQQATPITGNTLANYRNFKLKSQKEAE